jgi:hypothetical protein
LKVLVGATGFEPATPCAQGRCATRLRYAPTSSIITDASGPASSVADQMDEEPEHEYWHHDQCGEYEHDSE